MIVDPPPKSNSYESAFLSICYNQSMENKPNEVISKMVLTHILKCWEESKTQFHPSYTSIFPLEKISLKLCFIILKYNNFTDISSQIYTQLISQFRALYYFFHLQSSKMLSQYSMD